MQEEDSRQMQPEKNAECSSKTLAYALRLSTFGSPFVSSGLDPAGHERGVQVFRGDFE